ncbi:MAG: lipoprotein [Candidatus Thiodiazotropha sp.]
MKSIRYWFFLVLVLSALTLSGCGQKGPLHNPPENASPKPDQSQVS